MWKKGAAMGLWDATKWKDTDPEEQWARAITELLLGLPYNGSAGIYGKPNQDGIFYKPFSDPAAEPIAPIAAACQHLVSIGVLSRGYTYKDLLEMGFSCSEASSTRRTSCGAPGTCRSITRFTFDSSSIRPSLVWSRPAVSMIATSAPRETAEATVSKATAAGSAPCPCFTIGTPAR